MDPVERDSLLLDGIQADWFNHAKEVLGELANLHDGGCKRFWHIYGSVYFAYLSDTELLQLRDEVRVVWTPGHSDSEKQRIIDSWLSYRLGRRSVRYGADSPLWIRWRSRRVLPNPNNLRALLALGLVEHSERLAICKNPDCGARYFFAKRKGQRYCERGECTAYAQRQYALGWWNREGKQRRAKRTREKLGQGNSIQRREK